MIGSSGPEAASALTLRSAALRTAARSPLISMGMPQQPCSEGTRTAISSALNTFTMLSPISVMA